MNVKKIFTPIFFSFLSLCITVFFLSCSASNTENNVISSQDIVSESDVTATTTPPHVHNWGEWITKIPANCTSNGEQERLCDCGEQETRQLASLGHSSGNWVETKVASCTKPGEKQRFCQTCHAILGTLFIPATDHIPGEWVETKPVSCIEAGEQQQFCSICCILISTVLTPATGHTPGDWVEIQPASCTAQGKQQQFCAVCHAIIATSFTPAKNHISGDWIESQSASCTRTGEKQRKCIICSAVIETITIPKTEHTPGDWEIEINPTHIQSGRKNIKCLLCQSVLQQEGIDCYAQVEAERVAKVLNKIQSDTTFTFATLSDMHLAAKGTYSQIENTRKSSEMASKSLSSISKLSLVDAAVLLGDYTISYGAYTITDIKADFTLAKKYFSNIGHFPIAWLRGNHEINYSPDRERTTTDEELYEYIDKNSTGVIWDPDNPHRGYGYMDFSKQSIRIICLNTTDALAETPAQNGMEAPSAGISSTQLRWLVNTALNFTDKKHPEQWGIIICSHHPLNYNDSTQKALQILEAYKDGKSGVLQYTINEIMYTILYDFAGSLNAEIICSIHGHSHNFAHEKIGIDTPWLWRLCTPCITSGRENECATSPNTAFAKKWGEFDEYGNPVYYRKAYWSESANTYVYDEVSGTSYCIVTIDRENKMIYSHYVGVGINRIISYAT